MTQYQVMPNEKPVVSQSASPVSPVESNNCKTEDQPFVYINSEGTYLSATTASRKRKETMFPDLDVLTTFDDRINQQENTISTESLPLKRRKVPISRSSKSYTSIATAVESSSHPSDKLDNSDPLEKSHRDSLLFQLHYVSSDAETQGSQSANSSAEQFPSMSRGLDTFDNEQAVQSLSHSDKSSYGWFVELDDDDENDNEELAFTAVTAPKKNTTLDNEVDWACAADTVDDVLGDFF